MEEKGERRKEEGYAKVYAWGRARWNGEERRRARGLDGKREERREKLVEYLEASSVRELAASAV